jgi:hypothetical protein
MSKFELPIDELNPVRALRGVEQGFPDILSPVDSTSIIRNSDQGGRTYSVSSNDHRSLAKRFAETMGDGIFDEREQ